MQLPNAHMKNLQGKFYKHYYYFTCPERIQHAITHPSLELNHKKYLKNCKEKLLPHITHVPYGASQKEKLLLSEQSTFQLSPNSLTYKQQLLLYLLSLVYGIKHVPICIYTLIYNTILPKYFK